MSKRCGALDFLGDILKGDISQDEYRIFKASCAIPFVCKCYEVKTILYYEYSKTNLHCCIYCFKFLLLRSLCAFFFQAETAWNMKLNRSGLFYPLHCGLVSSKRSSIFFSPHSHIRSRICSKERPFSVMLYSTRGGTSAYTMR